MSRNMIQANENIFSSLITYLESASIETPFPIGKRYIKTDIDDKEWLKYANILTRQLIWPNLKTCLIQYDGKVYFAVVGLEKPFPVDEIMDLIKMNAGLATALLSELPVSIRNDVDPYRLSNEILFQCQNEESPDYSGHDYTDIINFFEPITIYRIRDDSPLEGDDIARLSGFFLCKNRKKLLLPFSDNTILTYEKLFLEGDSSIPFENLLLSLTSVFWKFSFLDVYRCIERLFPVCLLNKLHDNLGITIALIQFCAELENVTGWKPREIDTINNLVDDFTSDFKSIIDDIKCKIGFEPIFKTGSFLYEVRNSIVHYRPATEAYNIDESDWDAIICYFLEMVKSLYNKYHQKLSV